MTKFFFLISLIFFSSGCCNVEFKPVPKEIRELHDWQNLTFDQREKLQEKYGGIKATGTGQLDKMADGGIHIDTTAKLTVIGDVASDTLGHLSGMAKTVWSGAK